MDSPTCLLAHETNFWLWLQGLNHLDREISGSQRRSNEEIRSSWNGLIDFDEAFVSPCIVNESWCGVVKGFHTPRIKFQGMALPEDEPAEQQ